MLIKHRIIATEQYSLLLPVPQLLRKSIIIFAVYTTT